MNCPDEELLTVGSEVKDITTEPAAGNLAQHEAAGKASKLWTDITPVKRERKMGQGALSVSSAEYRALSEEFTSATLESALTLMRRSKCCL